jgi:cysteinyl-tRNA synthetase
MNEDATALGVATPDAEPRATAHMPQILDMIAALIDRGYAYLADNGDVYFRVRRFEYYGRLSGKTLDELRIGARVDVDESKDDPLDFVLWKAAKPEEPSWDSRWGRGRPGWHIECSAMSTHCLGNHFDIHGGGMDLKFPHHENEIAQSQASTAGQFVNTWMHVGFVRVNEEKMSKSLGNFFTVREVLKEFDPEVVRYFILNSHYRSPLDYSDGSLKQAKAGLTTLYTALRGIGVSSTAEEFSSPTGENPFLSRFYAAMDDDFNTPEALAVLFELGHEINRIRDEDPEHTRQQAALLRRLGAVLGLLQRDPDAFLQGAGPKKAGLTAAQIEAFIAERVQARKDKNWAQADRIRDSLSNQGIVLEDVAEGTTWRRE